MDNWSCVASFLQAIRRKEYQNQKKWYGEKKAKEKQKKTTARDTFLAKKLKCDEIRKRPRETWSVDNIQTLLSYKRQKNDPVIKKTKANRILMLEEYDRRSSRPTPPCSPVVDDEDSLADLADPTWDSDVEIEEI
jgi:hypothetical protein